MCRGTESGSVPPHSITSRSPKGNVTFRTVAPKREGTSLPVPGHERLAHDPEHRLACTARRTHAGDGVGDDDLVHRLEPLRRQPRGEVAWHVVGAERREQGDAPALRLRSEALVDDSRERLLPTRIEVMGTDADRGRDRSVPELEEGACARGNDGRAGERRYERRLVACVRDPYLVSLSHLPEGLGAAADEAKRDAEPARPLADESSRVPGGAEDGEHNKRKDTVLFMPVRVKRREYAVALDRAGLMTAEGDEPLETGGGWTPEHLLLAAVARCGINALRYHARRAGLELQGAASATGAVSQREEDGRYAFVEVDCRLEVELTPPPADGEIRSLLARAERGCFIGSSLTAHPRYSWIVNGQEIE